MGQAWCKERTSKAQDSKSPLDRVFVRCAHRIYPGLKEEGSVLGGATQRVTSSEIGYAGSPPREFLARGRSIDSLDRPFHPSEWVDVNLEVPTTPDPNIPRKGNSAGASSGVQGPASTRHVALATSPALCTKTKDAAPVPPPRKGRRNRGRPLPPKPDEIGTEKSSCDSKHVDTSDEPFYSSVNSTTKALDDYATMDDVATETRKKTEAVKRTKDVYEHKVNGTGKVISSDVVSGKRSNNHNEKKNAKVVNSHHRGGGQIAKVDNETRSKSEDRERPEVTARPKNYSTVSLPNYDQLDVTRHEIQSKEAKSFEESVEENAEDSTRVIGKERPKRAARSSTGSLPLESLSPTFFSQKTSDRLEDYIPRRDSTDKNLSEYQLPGKLASNENGIAKGEFFKYDPNKLADWEILADNGNCRSNGRSIPQNSKGNLPSIGVDVCDSSGYATIEETKGTFPRLRKPPSFERTSDSTDVENDCSEVVEDSASVKLRREIRKPDSSFSREKEEKMGLAKFEEGNKTKEQEQQQQQQQQPVTRTSQLDQSTATFTRSLSNESEPCELSTCESKELPPRIAVNEEMIKTISAESLPREMLNELVMDVSPARDEREEKSVAKTPPPSPELKEPKTKVEFLENEHSTLLKILKEEATEGSNLSSMTPSLTELEVALSDMLEKEEEEEEKTDSASRRSTGSRIVPFESSTPYSKGRKVSLCPWEEKGMILGDVDLHDECSRISTEEKRKSESPEKTNTSFNERLIEELSERSPSPPSAISAPPRKKHRSKENSDLFSSSGDRLV